MMTRRSTVAGLAGLGLAACGGDAPPRERAVGEGYGWGYAIYEGRRPIHLTAVKRLGEPGFTLDTPFRIASVTKLAVAELARRLHAQGAVDIDADAGALMGFALRHPDHPDTPVTIRQLLSHRAGLRDPEVYWMAHPGNIRTLLGPDIWEPGDTPGVSFRYCNLGYGIAATAIEAATDERFDRLFTQTVAVPLGLDMGLNWSGVSRERRLSAFPGTRGRRYDVQVDGAATLRAAGPAVLMQEGASLDTYVPGQNGTLFSPQGGLRASMSDMAVLIDAVVARQPDLWEPGWRWDGTVRPGGPSEDAHFIAFGEGVYIYPNGPGGRDTVPWIGHHGTAYGINCGAWLRADPVRPLTFVHAVTGDRGGLSSMTGLNPNQSRAASHAFAFGAESLRNLAQPR